MIYIFTLSYLFIITFLNDPLNFNYSMISNTFSGYLLVLGLSCFLGLAFYKTSHILKNNNLLCLFSPLLASIFPYVRGSNDLFSVLHEIMAYFSFGLILYISYQNISAYRFYNLKKANCYYKFLIIVLFLDLIYYFDSFKVNSLHEFILLTAITLIHFFIYKDVKNKS